MQQMLHNSPGNILFFLQILTLILPIFVSGVMLIISLKMNFFQILNIPIDHGKSVLEKRIFGDNKTYRGFCIHFTGIVLICLSLHSLAKTSGAVHPIFRESPLTVSLLYFLGYTTGELVNSAVKRRIGIPAGKNTHMFAQQFFDLSDGILVVGITLLVLGKVILLQAFAAVFLGIMLHYLLDQLMKKWGLKRK